MGSLADALKAGAKGKASDSSGAEPSASEDAWDAYAESCGIPADKRAKARRMLRIWMQENK